VSGRSLVQWSPTECGVSECGVSECDHESSIMRKHWPTRVYCTMVTKTIHSISYRSITNIQDNNPLCFSKTRRISVLLFVCICYVCLFLLLCTLRSVYSVSLCCSVYCLCVNVYWTTATGVSGHFFDQPN
jgi:hypothetical protein